MLKMPKTITDHPSVKECLDAKEEGFNDYKYDIELKSGWVFISGRMKGCNNARFKSVKEFIDTGVRKAKV